MNGHVPYPVLAPGLSWKTSMRVPALAIVVLAPAPAGLSQPVAAQSAAPDDQPALLRTSWGDPDLRGFVELTPGSA
jgi:hypothetical protein